MNRLLAAGAIALMIGTAPALAASSPSYNVVISQYTLGGTSTTPQLSGVTTTYAGPFLDTATCLAVANAFNDPAHQQNVFAGMVGYVAPIPGYTLITTAPSYLASLGICLMGSN